MSEPKKYRVLSVIALILKILAWVALAAGVIGMIVVSSNAGKLPDAMRPLATAGTWGTLLLGIVWFVQLFAFGSVLSLLIDIEESTREIASRP
jgi:amino acid transporter